MTEIYVDKLQIDFQTSEKSVSSNDYVDECGIKTIVDARYYKSLNMSFLLILHLYTEPLLAAIEHH